MNQENFEESFKPSFAGNVRVCSCGKIFYNYTYDCGLDWEEGEVESLEKNPTAENKDWAVSSIY